MDGESKSQIRLREIVSASLAGKLAQKVSLARTFLAPEGCTVHCLAHHPEHNTNRIVDGHVVVVLLLEQALCGA